MKQASKYIKKDEREDGLLAEMLSLHETSLSPRSQIGGGGTRELVGAVGAVELAVAHEVRLDALRHALQTPGNIIVLSWHVQGWAKKWAPGCENFSGKWRQK